MEGETSRGEFPRMDESEKRLHGMCRQDAASPDQSPIPEVDRGGSGHVSSTESTGSSQRFHVREEPEGPTQTRHDDLDPPLNLGLDLPLNSFGNEQQQEKTNFITSEAKDSVTYDEILSSLGEIGRHQRRVFLLLGLLYMSGCFQTLISVFTLAVPEHRCEIPGLANDTWQVQSKEHAALINISIPAGVMSQYSSCHVYSHVYPQSQQVNGNPLRHNQSDVSNPLRHNHSDVIMASGDQGEGEEASEMTTCGRYVYDTSVYISTIATDMDLVCGRALLRSHAQMMVMVGNLVGAQLAGMLSDAFGRKPVLMASVLLHQVAAIVVTWSSQYPVLMSLLFLLGMSVAGLLCPGFVMCMELVGPSKRKWTGYGLMAFWSLGMMLLAPLAYWLRDWQHLQLAASLLTLPFLSYWWLIPESPRWLLSKGRLTQAEVVILRTAHVNGRTLPPDMLKRVNVQTKASVSIVKACSNVTLIGRHLIILITWFVNSLTYYGLSWNVGTLSGSVYVNFLLYGVMELLSFVVCVLLLDRVGRRPLNCGLMMIAGVTCTATVFPVLYAGPSLQWLTVLLAMIGKLGISGSFNTLWVFSSELFPTVIRNSGMGTSSLCARIGGIVAPYIANLGKTIGGDAATAVPLVIFGVSSIFAGLLLLLLPETLNRRLPETIEDAINMKSFRKAKETDVPRE